jgi:hypothetical protein
LVAWVARFKGLWEQLEQDHFEEIQKALFLILPGHQPRWKWKWKWNEMTTEITLFSSLKKQLVCQ